MAEPDPAVQTEPKGVSGLQSFLSGGFGGVCLVLVGHPLDLIKVKLQTGTAYKGALDVAAQTLKNEGALGFYRGVSAPLVGVTPIFATCFWGYEMGQRVVRAVNKKPVDQDLTIAEHAVAGGLSALPATVLMAPVERVKCLLQIQSNEAAAVGAKGTRYTGMIDCGMQLMKTGGLSSVFKGWEATLVRDIPGSAAYFGVNVALKKQFKDERGKVSDIGILTAGGVAGMANWAIAIPPDVIKSRLQTAPEGTYTGMLDVYRTLMRQEGAGALFRGIGPAMTRAFPANAACFFGVDIANRFLEKLGI
ncbi:carnitine/acylcarnitine carrier protein [Tribonema minus]|uniref:Carnitine/acylcarnitine carrier protein n=1 Tax=Tribonema minus TaxID=303371 RepID=A0A835YHN3_9STRA|nr:carnitine/acylcarnitine carrier protein [Tribonema minus]